MKTLKPGEIAQYCDVHHRTVSRWIANGQLKGHKLPGRGNYRVQLDDFLSFLEQHRMPIPEALTTETQFISTTVLIVSNDQIFTAAISSALGVNGYEVLIASGSFEAGVKLMQFKPELIILDLDLPGLNSGEVVEVIQKVSPLGKLNVIVTSELNESVLAKTKALGVKATLPKPVENSSLIKLVADVLLK